MRATAGCRPTNSKWNWSYDALQGDSVLDDDRRLGLKVLHRSRLFRESLAGARAAPATSPPRPSITPITTG